MSQNIIYIYDYLSSREVSIEISPVKFRNKKVEEKFRNPGQLHNNLLKLA